MEREGEGGGREKVSEVRRKKKIGKGREGKVRGREKVKERRRGDVAGRLIIIVFHGTRKK
jgi:hypothetical protein